MILRYSLKQRYPSIEPFLSQRKLWHVKRLLDFNYNVYMP